ncbi:MAG: insulinase family protein [Phycisphaerae bacterium]|nr:insulinase family protein [Phycisphaerae bacterium]
MEFKTATLDNGLRIIAEVNPSAASMAAGFFARTGSRDETPEIAGVSHFLEHMVFKGTDRRSPMDVNQEFDRLGAQYNAFTSEENTVYYASVLPEFQADMLDLLCDIMRPALRTEDFDMEKGVICEEIAMYQDQPHFRLYDNIMANHFAGHPLGNSILGTNESITAMKRDDMQAYFDRRYSPTNVTMVAVGNLDFDALTAKVGAMCDSWRAFDTDRPVRHCDGSRDSGVITDAKLARQNLGLMSAAPSCQDADRFAAQVLATVLGDATGSRLYYALIETALADEAHTSYSPMDGTGTFVTFLSTAPAAAAKAMGIVHDEFAKFFDAGPTEAELTAAKNKIASSATLRGEIPMGRLTTVGFDWVYRNEYQTLAEQIEQLFAVSADDLLRVGRACDLNNPTVLALGPLGKLE